MIGKVVRFFSTVPKISAFTDVKQIKLEKFTQAQAQELLKKQSLAGWQEGIIDDKKPYIKKDFKFADFKTAFAFMNHIAYVADTMEHHPEWTHKDNSVEILLSTHDCQGISAKDFILARAIETVAGRLLTASPKFALEEGLISDEEILKTL